MTTSAHAFTLVLASYPPRVCGIATYTQDLLAALGRVYGNSARFRLCALERGMVQRAYPAEVECTLDTLDEQAYRNLAERVKKDERITGVWVQHEFGLYPGGEGRYLLDLLRSTDKTVTITFHTVLAEPGMERMQMVKDLAATAGHVVVLTDRSAELLRTVYGIAADKITVIAHGTHVIAAGHMNEKKRKLGLEGRMVLTNFGLLSSNKGIEVAIEAMPAIVREVPNAIYLVLGRTHPEIVKQEGEQYRQSLEARVAELGMGEHVQFVDRYLALDELLDYLCATDIYLFTSKDPQQAVSGTFAYAMGCGCPVISTRIPHAQEKLGDAGILIDFNDPQQLGAAALLLLKNDELRRTMATNALQRMSASSWENVAIAHMAVLSRDAMPGQLPSYKWPAVDLSHLKAMTTPLGIVQFSRNCEPDPASGHTLDDNARALIAMCMLASVTDRNPADLARTYLRFIRRCQMEDGSFLNYTDDAGTFTSQNQEVNLDDANGRAIWALGTAAATTELDRSMRDQASAMLQKALPHALTIRSPRAVAFIMKGLHEYGRAHSDPTLAVKIDRLGNILLQGIGVHFCEDWKWLEPEVTYGNAVIPEALLIGHLATGDPLYRETALSTMDFLLGHTIRHGRFKAVSNRNWLRRQQVEGPGYGEQPIEAAYTILALERFCRAFGRERYAAPMRMAFDWFLGRNHLHQTIYDRNSGGCRDGLEKHNVNMNEGAESTICYLLARLAMKRFHAEQTTGQKRLLYMVHPKKAGMRSMRRDPRSGNSFRSPLAEEREAAE
jgi:glycosyltransferase involved in cell wall biosynthesis